MSPLSFGIIRRFDSDYSVLNYMLAVEINVQICTSPILIFPILPYLTLPYLTLSYLANYFISLSLHNK